VKYYCIVLRETPERTARVQAEFEREGVPITWVWGVFGKAMEIKAETPMHSDYFVNRGVTALVLSHHFAWNLAQHDGADEFMVFEDDVVLPDNFLAKWSAIRAKVDEDVDGVYLQSCCVDDQKWKRKYRDELWDVRYPLCTAAIWWRARAIPTLIEHTKPANTPVDILLEQKALRHLKVLTVLPELVGQLTLQGKMESMVQA
jgi:GR25 family glycosyltransferase involved in LPS biosynthesis